MDDIQVGGAEEEQKEVSIKGSFMKHVFNFDNQTKNELTNIIQYSIIGLLPVIIINKFLQKYIPQTDETKGSLEIVSEVMIQVIVIIVGIYYSHRLITFIPTLSGAKYVQINVLNIVLVLLVLALTVQTKLGEKMHLLADRVFGLWNGEEAFTGAANTNNTVQVRQPISSGINNMEALVPMHQPGRSDNMQGGNPPPQAQLTSLRSGQNNISLEQSMQAPMNTFEPMAANDGGGGFANF
jgi:hypothetical protein